VILMVTLGAGATKRVTADIGSLGDNMLLVIPGQQRGPPTAVVPFDMSTVDAVQRDIPGLAEVVPELAVQGVAVNGNHNHATQINGTTNAYLVSRDWDLSQGRDFSPAEILGGKSVCIVGQTVRKELYGDQVPIGTRLRINKATCEIIGFLSPKGEKFVRPIRADDGALRPGEAGALSADFRTFPLGLGVPYETVSALIEDEISDGDFAGHVGGVRAVVAEDQNAVGVRDVDEVGRELGKTVTPFEEARAGAGFDDHVTNALGFVEQHEAVLVGDAADMIAEFVGGVGDGVDPIAFAEVPGIDATVANLGG